MAIIKEDLVSSRPMPAAGQVNEKWKITHECDTQDELNQVLGDKENVQNVSGKWQGTVTVLKTRDCPELQLALNVKEASAGDIHSLNTLWAKVKSGSGELTEQQYNDVKARYNKSIS